MFVQSARRFLAIAIVIVWQMFVTSLPAFAHVGLVQVEPEDGATLPSAPSEVRLWFSEPIAAEFTSVHLLNENSQELTGVSIHGSQAEANAINVTLPMLKTGGYTLFWKTMSAVDGHVTQGFTLFTIGTVSNNLQPARPAIQAPSTSDSTWIEGGLRWLNYVATAGIVGALTLFYFVLSAVKNQPNPIAKARQQRLRQNMLGWAAICAHIAFLAGCGLFAWQMTLVQASSSSTTGWLSQGFALVASHWGNLWLVRQALLLLLGLGLWGFVYAGAESIVTWFHLAISGRVIDLLIVQALAGHALGSGQNELLALSNATIHLLASGIWIGSIIALVVVAMPALRKGFKDAPDWQPIRWKSFSLLAALSVCLLLITGLYSMARSVASPDALLTTAYGQLLLGKIGVVLLVGFCGLINAILVHPARILPLMRRLGVTPNWVPLPVGKLPRLLVIEFTLGVLVFGVTGFLTSLPPPRGAEFTIAPEDIHPLLGQRIDGLFFKLQVTPNRPGRNLVSLHIAHDQVAEVEDVPQVKVKIGKAGEDAAYRPVRAAREDATLFQLNNETLATAGPVEIDVLAKRDGKEDVVAHFSWMVAPIAQPQAVVWSKRPLATPLTMASGTGLLLLLIGLALWQFRKRFSPKLLVPLPARLDLNVAPSTED